MNNIRKALILGATGNFGSKIAELLLKSNISIILAGRNVARLNRLKNQLIQKYSDADIEISSLDIKIELESRLNSSKPFVVINTCGPFQATNYDVPATCIHKGIHYIDLADARNYVVDFPNKLDRLAKNNNCLAVAGASTVPCLSSAVLDFYQGDFNSYDSIKYGISPGQKTDRGLATVKAILSYVGKPFKSTNNAVIYGWQDLYCQPYPILGKRWMANCDIPDLDLLPKLYGIKELKFSAGLESTTLHLALWLLSWLVRIKLPINLEKHAKLFLRLSHHFDKFGSADGGMHILMKGSDKTGTKRLLKWFIVAKNGSGPYIPAVPAAILARKLIQGQIRSTGASACIKLITLDEYLNELKGFDIEVIAKFI